MADPEKIIPENRNGIQTNTESSVELATEEEAKKFFEVVKERLLDVNKWHECAGSATADFQLTDEKGNRVERKPKQGDHFRIDTPAPGSIAGDGKDWVQIEAIDEDENCLGIRVRPATNPSNDQNDVAHFFDEQSSSSFVVKREGKKITAGIYGRNEKPNTDTEKLVDKFRNIVVAGGAISGLSKLQWKSLVNGLVKKTDPSEKSRHT